MFQPAAREIFAVIVAVLLGSGLLGVRTAFADYYRYTDSSGTVCLTNDLKSIPERYRKKAVLVSKDAPKAEQPKPAVSQPSADQAAGEAVSQPRAPAGFRERAAALFTKDRMMTTLKIVGAIVLVVAAYTGIVMIRGKSVKTSRQLSLAGLWECRSSERSTKTYGRFEPGWQMVLHGFSSLLMAST